MDLKICGLCHKDDLVLCLSQGIPYVGFILVESSKRVVTAVEITQIWEETQANNASSKPVFVVANESLDVLIRLGKNWSASFQERPCVQLHGDESPDYVAQLLATKVFAEVWKAIKIDQASSLSLAQDYKHADLILFDAIDPGSGNVFDWAALSSIDKKMRWGLAGGVNEANILQAVVYRPNLIDVSSGSESGLRRKDAAKILGLWQAVKSN